MLYRIQFDIYTHEWWATLSITFRNRQMANEAYNNILEAPHTRNIRWERLPVTAETVWQ